MLATLLEALGSCVAYDAVKYLLRRKSIVLPETEVLPAVETPAFTFTPSVTEHPKITGVRRLAIKSRRR